MINNELIVDLALTALYKCVQNYFNPYKPFNNEKHFVFIGAMRIISTSGHIQERSKKQTQIAQNSKVLFQMVKMYLQLMRLCWA